jgi:endonuclease-3
MAKQAQEPLIGAQSIQAILRVLDKHYPDARCTLDHQSPVQLLVATILSAQCTDERVNRVTPGLFARYPDARSFAAAPLEDLEMAIQSTGFFRNKAKAIQGCCRQIVEHHGGEVPADLDALVKLPGVGRKTANVILGNAFQVPGIVVDTHVGRIAGRLGLTRHKDPDKIERDLMGQIPRERWTRFSHQLILHGRAICQARQPKCANCPANVHCEYFCKQGQVGTRP